jgi:hypothetical protein
MAAIACLADPAGWQVALALRSERSGQVVFFGPDDELREWQGQEVALDAALSFAESMGFLFEDDRVRESPEEARRLWDSLLDASGRPPTRLGAPTDPAPGAQPPAGAADPAEDFDLESDPEEELWLDEVAPAGPLVSATVPLTKFRRLPGAPARGAGGAAQGARGPLARFRFGPAGRRP